MAYEKLEQIKAVKVGGVDEKTRRPHPTELEGYFVNVEKRPNKMKPGTTQNFYIFLTAEGLRGVYGKAGIDQALKPARKGVMTKLVSTGKTLDVGKPRPMDLYEAFSDKTNVVDLSQVDYAPGAEIAEEGSEDVGETQYADSYEETPLDTEEAPVDELPPVRATRPATPAQAPSAARQAQVQALLNKGRATRTA